MNPSTAMSSNDHSQLQQQETLNNAAVEEEIGSLAQRRREIDLERKGSNKPGDGDQSPGGGPIRNHNNTTHSVFFTRQLLPGYPKTHLSCQYPFTGCKVSFQMNILRLVPFSDELLFGSSDVGSDNSSPQQVSPDTQDKAYEKEDQPAIDSFIVDRILSDKIAAINRLKKTSIHMESIYQSDINEGESMTIERQWTEGDVHRMAEALEDGTKNLPMIEYLLTNMQIGEKVRVFCSSDYFTGFEQKYNLVEEGNAEVDASHLLADQKSNQRSRQQAEEGRCPHGFRDKTLELPPTKIRKNDHPKDLSAIAHGECASPESNPDDSHSRVEKYLVVEIETNIFELPEHSRIAEAKQYKELGNQAFKDQKLDTALDHYFKAQRFLEDATTFSDIDLRKKAVQLLAEVTLNIAAILLKNKNADSVIRFTDQVLDLYHENEDIYIVVKALFRRASAYSLKEEYDLALQDCNNALALQPCNSAHLSLKKQLTRKRRAQMQKEKSLYSGFFSASSQISDNADYISQQLRKSFSNQMCQKKIPLGVIFNISEYLGYRISNFALVSRDFHHIAYNIDDRWKLICLRLKMYNERLDPEVYKWKRHFITVYCNLRCVFHLPQQMRAAVFPDLSAVNRGSNDFFVDTCRRVTAHVDPNRIYKNEDAMIYAGLKQLHKYWTLQDIYNIFGVQADLGSKNSIEETVALLRKNISDYRHECPAEELEAAKYMDEQTRKVHTVDEIFASMMESKWGRRSVLPTIMRCAFTYYNIQPKHLKMGFFCSDGLLALILDDGGFLQEETIRKWFR